MSIGPVVTRGYSNNYGIPNVVLRGYTASEEEGGGVIHTPWVWDLYKTGVYLWMCFVFLM